MPLPAQQQQQQQSSEPEEMQDAAAAAEVTADVVVGPAGPPDCSAHDEQAPPDRVEAADAEAADGQVEGE
jgi:hypothetical protein